jgi:hypothetical protein
MLWLLEKTLMVLDWLAAAGLVLMGMLAAAVGLLFGFLSFLERGDLSGFGGTLVTAATLLLTGFLCAVASAGMKRGAWWRWYAQVVPIPVFVVGFSAGLCLSGAGVVAGPVRIC